MNLLPFVISFILIFSIAMHNFFHKTRTLAEEKSSYTQSYYHLRTKANKLQKHLYQKQKGEPLNHKANASKKHPPFTSHRDAVEPTPQQKLYIGSLIQDIFPQELEHVALTLIKNLYQKTTLYFPDMEKEVLELIVKTIKANPTVDALEGLFPHIPQEKRALFYKLLKGTQKYTLYKSSGYPPLGNFIRLEKKRGTAPLYLRSASRPVLKAMFGSSITAALIQEERQKSEVSGEKEPLSKDELNGFFLKHRINLSSYDQIIRLP